MEIELEKFLKEIDNENLYSILSTHKDADALELRLSFKKLMKIHHPDKVPDSKKVEATKKFQKIQKVYNLLKNQIIRDQYNKHLSHLEERKERAEKMTIERKKFHNDLIKRENEGKESNFDDIQKQSHKRTKRRKEANEEEAINTNNDSTFRSKISLEKSRSG